MNGAFPNITPAHSHATHGGGRNARIYSVTVTVPFMLTGWMRH